MIDFFYINITNMEYLLNFKNSRKKVREQFLYKTLNYIEKGNIPKELIGVYIRILHFIIP